MQTKKIRPEAVADSFYPSDAKELDRIISKMMENAEKKAVSGTPRIIIAPHAGYVYSGAVAASAFKTLDGYEFRRVIIIGRSHQAYFNNVSVDDNDAWQTPIGTLDLDTEFINKLISESDVVVKDAGPHKKEHSLEVMVPFIVKAFGLNTKIVPLLFGNEDSETEKKLADALSGLIDDKTLAIVSTDLSHYPTPNNAKKLDQATITAIMTNNPNVFHAHLNRVISENPGQAETLACGETAVGAALYLSQNLGLKPTLITSTNSGEVHPESSANVVGYAAFVFSDENADSNEKELNQEEQNIALMIARNAIASHFDENNYTPETNSFRIFDQERGAFVTLRKDESLRGCIGVFEPKMKLSEVLKNMAISAAFEDPRFIPLEADELDDVSIEISVLSPMKRINSVDEIELGKHGVYIKRGSQSGVYLPQVAAETGWDKNTFLNSLCIEKAGLEAGCWRDKNTELRVFTAQVFAE